MWVRNTANVSEGFRIMWYKWLWASGMEISQRLMRLEIDIDTLNKRKDLQNLCTYILEILLEFILYWCFCALDTSFKKSNYRYDSICYYESQHCVTGRDGTVFDVTWREHEHEHEHDMTWNKEIWHNTAWHNTTQHNTAWHNTTWHEYLYSRKLLKQDLQSYSSTKTRL